MSASDQDTDTGLPREGDILAGKYRVERVIGQGGMGVVVAAQHLTLRTTVAVKLLLPEAMERQDSVGRFLREGRSAMSIQSEHIARVLDFGTLESGQPFMAMEYLVGDDLGDVIKTRGALPIPEAVDYVLQGCEAIAEAHSLGIIHRDLKPANLFVTRRADGTAFVKVLDFGLSKPTKIDALEPSLTSANTVMGSPYYMSPEQVRSLKHIDARADVWALGVILYQLVSGHRPFEEESLGALFVMIGAEPPTSIRKYLPDIPEPLEAIIFKCLEKAPANRFQTVAELARALAPFASDSARISIERILRVLSDHAPLPRHPLDSLSEIDRVSTPGAAAGAPVEAATRTVPLSTGPSNDAAAKPPSQESMPGMSSSLAGPAIEAASRTGQQAHGNRSSVAVYVAATALALVAGAVTVIVMMTRPGASTAQAGGDPRPAPTQIAATATPPSPSVVPAPATAAQAATEAASASAAPAAVPPGAPSSSSASKKAPWPTKKKTDPLDRR